MSTRRSDRSDSLDLPEPPSLYGERQQSYVELVLQYHSALLDAPWRSVILYLSVCAFLTALSAILIVTVDSDDDPIVDAFLFIWGVSPLCAAAVTILVITIGTKTVAHDSVVTQSALVSPHNDLDASLVDPYEHDDVHESEAKTSYYQKILSVSRVFLLYYILPITIPTVVGAIQYAFAVGIGAVGPYDRNFLNLIESTLPINNQTAATVTAAFAYEYTLGSWWDLFPPNNADWGDGTPNDWRGGSWMLLAIMEEVGWMGVLFPCIMALLANDLIKSSFVTGFIWCSWHFIFIILPLIISDLPSDAVYITGTIDTPVIYGIIMFTLSTIFARIIIIHLYEITNNSIFVACLFHAAHNVMIYSFFAQLPDANTREYPAAPYFIAESGVITVVGYGITAAVILWDWNAHKRPPPPPTLDEIDPQDFVRGSKHPPTFAVDYKLQENDQTEDEQQQRSSYRDNHHNNHHHHSPIQDEENDDDDNNQSRYHRQKRVNIHISQIDR